MKLKLVVLMAGLLASWAAQAAVTLLDLAGIETALERGAPCCVVDARSEAVRKSRPLVDAVVYRAGVKIHPTAAVVVIADTDRQALSVGRALARDNGAKEVVAVKGGMPTWLAFAERQAQGAGEPGAPGGAAMSFVIPKNTCESGTPLQELRSGRK